MKHNLLRSVAVAVTATFLAAPLSASAAPFDKIETVAETPLASFQKVYIAPVTVELDESNFRRNIRDTHRDRPVRERDQALKAEDTYEDLVRAFERKDYVLVDAPGADVLTVETTITGMDSSRPTLADYDINTGLSFNSIYAGGAEFDIRLSQGDTLITAINEDYQTSLNDGRPRISVWQDVDRATQRVASRLARYVSKN